MWFPKIIDCPDAGRFIKKLVALSANYPIAVSVYIRWFIVSAKNQTAFLNL
jgi:hypothetical protein